MKMIRTTLAALALLSVAPAIAQTNDKPLKTIVVDNRAPCMGGRIGEGRQFMGAFTARNLAKDLRKQGFKVRIVTLSAGYDQTMPDDSFQTFTSPC